MRQKLKGTTTLAKLLESSKSTKLKANTFENCQKCSILAKFWAFVKIVAFLIFPKKLDFSEILQNDRSKKLGLHFESKMIAKMITH